MKRNRKAPLQPVADVMAKCDVARARRLEPPMRIDRMPEEQALRIWKGRILRGQR